MQPKFNGRLLMSGASYMTNDSPINAYMHDEPFDTHTAIKQHDAIKQALESIGIEVIPVAPPVGCQDGIFTANWALTRGNKALMSSLPTVRRPEEAYARKVLQDLGMETSVLPEGVKFSGQGDALPCGDYVFAGTGYRTDKAAHTFIEDVLGYKVIGVQAMPEMDSNGRPVINQATGWPDSRFYDLDLAISILRPPLENQKGLIAWCPTAFMPESQELIRSLEFADKIEVSLEEAVGASACNLVSTGAHVVMNANAPNLSSAIEAKGLQVIILHNEELLKNGGSVRCTTLALDNL
jgi:N-dimethylarginine dimethylaminohydrolase